MSSQGDEDQATSKHKPDSVLSMRVGLEFYPWPRRWGCYCSSSLGSANCHGLSPGWNRDGQEQRWRGGLLSYAPHSW